MNPPDCEAWPTNEALLLYRLEHPNNEVLMNVEHGRAPVTGGETRSFSPVSPTPPQQLASSASAPGIQEGADLPQSLPSFSAVERLLHLFWEQNITQQDESRTGSEGKPNLSAHIQ